MAAKPDGSTRINDLASGGRPPPLRYVRTIMLGLALGTLTVGGYFFWSHRQAQQALAAAGDPGLARPAPRECQIARAAIARFHASGDDRRWLASIAEPRMTLDERSQVINPASVPDYADDEARDLRGKGAADWRWCGGLGAFVGGLGWRPVGGDEDIPELALGRPAMNAAGDEAKVYEAFIAPQGAVGAPMLQGGPWLATLRRAPDGAWSVTAIEALRRPGH